MLIREDGADGVPQGTLQPGRETTTNTYEGHQFYFTQHKVKANEIARVFITENQVRYEKCLCISLANR